MRKLTTLLIVGTFCLLGLSSCAVKGNITGPKFTFGGPDMQMEGRLGPQSMLESK